MDTPYAAPDAHPLSNLAGARWWILAPLFLLIACGPAPADNPDAGHEPDTELPDGSDPDGDVIRPPPDTPPSGPIESREDQLRELGFDVEGLEASPRKMTEEIALGEEFSPIGTVAHLAPKELAIAGMGGSCVDPEASGERVMTVEVFHQPQGTASPPSVRCALSEEGNFRPTVSRAQGNLEGPGAQNTRTLVTGDFDGDGLDEGLLLNGFKRGDRWEVHGAQFEHRPDAPAPLLFQRDVGADRIWDTASAKGDFNGDARDDALLAMIQGHQLVLIPMLQDDAANLDQSIPREANVHALKGMSGSLSLTMAAGNLDTDHQHEVVVVVRAFGARDAEMQPIAEVRIFIFDNLPEGENAFPLLKTETLTYTDPTHGADQKVKVADVAIADFDGDGLGEIALAGIGRFYDMENSPDGCAPYTYVTRILDDLAHGGGALDTRVEQAMPPNCGSQNYGAGVIYERFARALEYDGLAPFELLINHQLYRMEEGKIVEVQGSRSTSGPLTFDRIYPADPYHHFSEATVSLSTSDVSGDARDEVLVYNNLENRLLIRGNGITDTEPNFIREVVFIRSGAHPQIVPLNSDDDGSVVRFIPGSHRVVLSEPIVHVVLAAPPFSEAWGQDPGNAVTSYSTSSSTGTSHESTLTTSFGGSMSVHIGIGILDLLTFGVEVGAEYEETLTRGQGSAYTLTRTERFETAGKDAVVFSAVPYDVYDYRILRSDRPELRGKTLSIMLPRTAYTRIVSREYFNARVPEGGLKIGTDILPHQAGVPESYMSHAERTALADSIRAMGEPVMLSQLQTVGEGSTTTSASIEVEREEFHIMGYGSSHTFSVAFTGGITTNGFTKGSAEENTMVTTYSETTTVEGSVPSITVDDTDHPEAVYKFGLMTYMHPAKQGDQSFQVINYWVE